MIFNLSRDNGWHSFSRTRSASPENPTSLEQILSNSGGTIMVATKECIRPLHYVKGRKAIDKCTSLQLCTLSEGRDRVSSSGDARKGSHKTVFEPIFLAYPISKKEGWHVAFLYRLSCVECNDNERYISIPINNDMLDELDGSRYFFRNLIFERDIT